VETPRGDSPIRLKREWKVFPQSFPYWMRRTTAPISSVAIHSFSVSESSIVEGLGKHARSSSFPEKTAQWECSDWQTVQPFIREIATMTRSRKAGGMGLG
jgi:hypothetical protein